MLILHNYWSSVCSRKVRLCLAEKGLAFENRHVNLFDFEHWRPDYLKLDPKGVVPALDHDGNIVIESSLICEYLDEFFPSPPLMPASTHARARARCSPVRTVHVNSGHPSKLRANHGAAEGSSSTQ